MGVLRASFVPPKAVRDLRGYIRARLQTARPRRCPPGRQIGARLLFARLNQDQQGSSTRADMISRFRSTQDQDATVKVRSLHFSTLVA